MLMSRATDELVMPEARLDDLDLDDPTDEAIWEARLAVLAARRIGFARARLERMGIVDREGKLVSRELPLDMLPDSESSVNTG